MGIIKEQLKKIADSNSVTESMHRRYIRFKIGRDFEIRKKNADMNGVEKLYNTKCGKRCFIVGNGPSLTISDLDKIKEEDTFATNRIYRIYNKTQWRPTYYVCQDRRVAEGVHEGLKDVISTSEHIFLNSSVVPKIDKCYKNNPKVHFIFLNDVDRNGEYPLFSNDILNQIYEGNTVTYACIQMAVYMGYSEIYIIGVDHNYNIERKKDGMVVEHKGVQNYMPGLEVVDGDKTFLPELDKSTLAYRVARKICDERGIVIRNATRGGKLEEFVRANLDNIV